jgi:hypothetical protein
MVTAQSALGFPADPPTGPPTGAIGPTAAIASPLTMFVQSEGTKGVIPALSIHAQSAGEVQRRLWEKQMCKKNQVVKLEMQLTCLSWLVYVCLEDFRHEFRSVDFPIFYGVNLQ